MKNLLCELCRSRDATLVCTRVVNNFRYEIHLCSECAALEGFATTPPEESELFDDLADSFFESEPVIHSPQSVVDVCCPRCNTSRSEFERTGLLGCSVCYEVFAGDLEILMRRLHGATQHSGRRPRPRRIIGALVDEAALRQEMQQAIAEENFERAAELRDVLSQARSEERNAGLPRSNAGLPRDNASEKN